MPSFTARPLHVGRTVRVTRWLCDGHDTPRPVAEVARRPMVMIVTSGRFAFRDRGGRAVASPTTAIAVDSGHEYEIRHPFGLAAAGCGDTTIAIVGDLPRELFDARGSARPMSVPSYLELVRLAALPSRGDLAAEELALAAIDLLGAPAPAPDAAAATTATRADRDIAAAIDHAIDVAAGVDVDLAALAAEANVTTAHACRAYRRARGGTIHARVTEARLRHALALVVDTDDALAEVATATGFANQGHLGNAFRARFGTTPGRARKQPELIRAR
ncbi:MAG TPA: helix-turn-helix transcriptional regulator [Kofleriaceae bacterium]|nr:helix-turn-helix transcriptional regulator [Kofleriaceae bacterium]